MPDIEAPQDDLDLVTNAADMAMLNYAQNGRFNPFCIIDSALGVMVVPTEGFTEEAHKREFVSTMRFLSIEHAGRRSAFAMEAWTMFDRSDEAQALLQEIYDRGGSMREHPSAGEAVFVIVESDAGTTTRMHRIVRDGADTRLEAGETDFQPMPPPGVPIMSRGIFSNFHVPTHFQSSPAAQTFANTMRQVVGVKMERITPTGMPPAN